MEIVSTPLGQRKLCAKLDIAYLMIIRREATSTILRRPPVCHSLCMYICMTVCSIWISSLSPYCSSFKYGLMLCDSYTIPFLYCDDNPCKHFENCFLLFRRSSLKYTDDTYNLCYYLHHKYHIFSCVTEPYKN